MRAILLGGLSACAVIAFVAMAYRRGWRWTGLPAETGDGSDPPRRAKTLWDWLQLLIIPAVLALGAFALNATQVERDRQREERGAARDRAIAQDRAREDTLRAYLQQMSDLMTVHGLRAEPDLRLGNGAPTEVSTLARTLTLIVLRRLDVNRKSIVVQFLSESHLIRATSVWDRTPLGYDARPPDPRGLDQARVSLKDADLRGVHIRGLSFRYRTDGSSGKVTVSGANFDGADLRHADFHGLALTGVTLRRADLRDADLGGADLSGAAFTESCLSGARFARASAGEADPMVFSDFTGTQGRDVDFSRARLDHADFRKAALTGVDLRGATTADTRWPTGWGTTGIPTSDPGARHPCARFPP